MRSTGNYYGMNENRRSVYNFRPISIWGIKTPPPPSQHPHRWLTSWPVQPLTWRPLKSLNHSINISIWICVYLHDHYESKLLVRKQYNIHLKFSPRDQVMRTKCLVPKRTAAAKGIEPWTSRVRVRGPIHSPMIAPNATVTHSRKHYVTVVFTSWNIILVSHNITRTEICRILPSVRRELRNMIEGDWAASRLCQSPVNCYPVINMLKTVNHCSPASWETITQYSDRPLE